MCTAADYAFFALSVAAVTAFVANAILQSRFLSKLEATHPTLWHQLGKRRPFTEDGNFSYAAAQWYLIAGEFNYSNEPDLVRSGKCARSAFVAFLILAAACLAVTQVAGTGPERLSCLLPVQD